MNEVEKAPKILWKILWSLGVVVIVLFSILLISWLWPKVFKEDTESEPEVNNEIIHRELFMRTIVVNFNTSEWRYYSLESIIAEAEIRGYEEEEIYFSFNDATNSYCVLNGNNHLVCGEVNEDISGELPWDVEANRHLRFKSKDGTGTLTIKVYSK